MFVVAAIQWLTNAQIQHCPTQLAAVRVDENWNHISCCSTLIRPRDSSFYEWENRAYSGAKAIDFMDARGAYNTFSYFLDWLREDDVIIWWHIQSAQMFEKFVGMILKRKVKQKMISINDRVYAHMKLDTRLLATPYKAAEQADIYVDEYVKYCARNDVDLICKLMSEIGFPQAQLFEPFTRIQKEKNVFKSAENRNSQPYQYDKETNTIHKRECALLDKNVATHGYGTLAKAVQKKYTPCECCKEEYREILKKRSRRIIEDIGCNYVHTSNSKVFHKPDCRHMYYARTIFGTNKFIKAINAGGEPCKTCNPVPIKKAKKKADIIKLPQEKTIAAIIDSEENRAVKRQKIAFEERVRKLSRKDLTEREIQDVYTLTQPGFSFWAGKGCRTFHIHSCSKIKTTSELKGFVSYEHAVNSGYKPCRHCKPTAKHNLNVSIPISNKFRKDDRIENIVYFCLQEGYAFRMENEDLYVETPVGKWHIKKSEPPIHIEHINLIVTPQGEHYHKQPRLFLSFIDVFKYIKRHDDSIVESFERNRA